MSVQEQVVKFLRTHPSIDAVNFCFLGQKIWPQAYRRDVADAVARGDIRQGNAVNPGVAATFRQEQDRLEIRPSFNFSSLNDLGYLLHECTHAIIDMRAIGPHSAHLDEAVAYMAQGLFLVAATGEAAKIKDEPMAFVPNDRKGLMVYHEARRIAAKAIRNRAYYIPDDEARRLVQLVATNPVYKDSTEYVSNRFRRSIRRGMERYSLPVVCKVLSMFGK